MVRSTKIKRRTIVWTIVLMLFMAGCQGKGSEAKPFGATATSSIFNDSSPSPDGAPAIPLTSITNLQNPLTLEKVIQQWKTNLTLEQARALFGVGSDFGESFLTMDGRPVKINRRQFGESNGLLTLEWTKEGKLVQAVFVDRDSWGRVRNYFPAIGDSKSSSSEDNVIAKDNGIGIGTEVTLYGHSNCYEWWGGLPPRASSLLDTGTKFKVTALSADFANLQEIEVGRTAWVPVWYLTSAAGDVREIKPITLRVTAAVADAFWYPASVEAAASLKQGDTVQAYREYGDWYGIAIPAKDVNDWYPGLTWIKKSDTQSTGSAEGIFNHYGFAMTAADLMAVVKSELTFGMSKARVKEVLGEPTYTEKSRNVAEVGRPAATHVVWRYENTEAQLLIQWDNEGKLLSFNLRDSSGRADITFQEVNALEVLGDPVRKPFVPSEPVSWAWRYKSDLPYNFMKEKIGNLVLVAGEDGGFSGMHMNSNLYALRADTGKLVWRYDFGYESHQYGLSADKKRIAFLKQTSEYQMALDIWETATGRQLWKSSWDLGNGLYGWGFTLAVSGDMAVVGYQANGTTDSEHPSYMEGWNLKSGKRAWKIQLTDASELVAAKDNVAVVLVGHGIESLQERTAKAYSPATGQLLWERKDTIPARFQAIGDTAKTAAYQQGIWLETADHLLLVEPESGLELVKLPIAQTFRYTSIDPQGRWFFKHESGDGSVTVYSSSVIKTSLIDATTGRIVWTKEGNADSGQISENILYYSLNGNASAYDLKSKRDLWNVDWQADGPFLVVRGRLLAGSTASGNVYSVDPASGEPIFRWLDERLGLYDFTPAELLRGYISVENGVIYAGSSNGYFGRLK